ncbi:MAG: alternative ribosome rescue aminoacyl-tRNA hydrolase ArfB [Salibacteraceae bacterium]
MKLTSDDISSIVFYRTSRSSGPGGQSVNKAETRVEALLPLAELPLQKEYIDRIIAKLGTRVNANQHLIVASSETRSQKKNKEVALKRMLELINEALYVAPKRKKTSPSRSAIKKRLDEKSRKSDIKQGRRWKMD